MPINPPNPPVIPSIEYSVDEETWMMPPISPRVVVRPITRQRAVATPIPQWLTQTPATEWLQSVSPPPAASPYNWFTDYSSMQQDAAQTQHTAQNQALAAGGLDHAAEMLSVRALRRYMERSINPPVVVRPSVFTVLTEAQREFYEAVYHGAEFQVGQTYDHSGYGVTPSSCTSQQEEEIVEQRRACGLTSPNHYDSMEFRDERPKLERNEIEALPLPG